MRANDHVALKNKLFGSASAVIALDQIACSGICAGRWRVFARTFPQVCAMSALPPKADMCSATRYVRFVPIADIA